MKKTAKFKRSIALLLVMTMLLSMLLSGCGNKVKAGDYTGSVLFDHPMEVMGSPDGNGDKQLIENWGCDIKINVDEDGVIWNIDAVPPKDGALYTSEMMWSVFGGKFIGSISGNLTCKDIMDIKVDVEDDGFPVITGDCGGIHVPEGTDIVLLNDYEVSCAIILLAIQNAITTNNLV